MTRATTLDRRTKRVLKKARSQVKKLVEKEAKGEVWVPWWYKTRTVALS